MKDEITTAGEASNTRYGLRSVINNSSGEVEVCHRRSEFFERNHWFDKDGNCKYVSSQILPSHKNHLSDFGEKWARIYFFSRYLFQKDGQVRSFVKKNNTCNLMTAEVYSLRYKSEGVMSLNTGRGENPPSITINKDRYSEYNSSTISNLDLPSFVVSEERILLDLLEADNVWSILYEGKIDKDLSMYAGMKGKTLNEYRNEWLSS